jgi:hypothetical protein
LITPRSGAVISVALLAAFVVWLVAIRDEGEAVESTGSGSGPVAMTEDEIVDLASELGHPIFWAGPQGDAELEVTQSPGGQVQVRYLTGGAQVGSPQGDFLVVGTYPISDAQTLLEGAAEREGALEGETPDGDLVVTNEDSPSNVHLADASNDLQIEVYDPDPERAFELATGGDIVPID